MRVLVLGLNPSRRLGKSPSLKRLYSWLDQLDLQYVSFCNIYAEFGQFSLRDIDRNYICEITRSPEKVIALGAKTSDILRLMGIPHFRLPHPSNTNRQLNSVSYVRSQLEKCREYLWT